MTAHSTDRAITDDHLAHLHDAAIGVDVATAVGVRSVTELGDLPEEHRWCRQVPGLLFPWHSPSGDIVTQYRPDTPVTVGDTARKYLWPKGRGNVLNVHPAHAGRLSTARLLVVVEGTKQTLAAVTAAGSDVAVIGVAGCYGWSTDGAAIPDAGLIPWAGREVVVIFDADVTTNPNVHEAARRFSQELELFGASKIRFVDLPGGGNDGLDDVLAGRRVNGLTEVTFAKLLEKAGKLPSKPARRGGAFMGSDGLMVAKLGDAVRQRHHLAVDPGDRLLVYVDGVYVDGRHVVTATIGDLLGDAYRPLHARAVVELLTSRLVADGLLLTDSPSTALVNVTNGLLDPFTGTLSEHTPEHLSLVQFPVAWDPTATCPTFDRWIDEVTDDRGDDLLESTAQVLDMRGQRQRKAVFAHGPTRSGKSTFLRLIEAVVGPDARAAVTLHDLAGNRFAAADLFGKVLNTANELSAGHVDDLSTFKAVTGDDPVRAERKYGQPFTFRNKALFMFAANEIPTVSEVSGAYLARIRPYEFPHTYEGREDPSLEVAMLRELPGVLVRLVEALRRFDARGGYADDVASRAALDDFARHSDRVRLFLHETTTPDPDAFTERTELFTAFELWAQQNRRQILGKHRFYKHVETAGYRVTKRRGTHGFVGIDVRHEDEWGAPDPPEAADPPAAADPADPPEPAESAVGGQKGQFSHTPASREVVEEGSRVREGYAETAPSAPSIVGRRVVEEF